MAGHSKWANIQHRKNAQDAKRGKIFTKVIREITVAVRASGTDPDSNPRPAPGHRQGPRLQHEPGQHRARDQEGDGTLEGVIYEEIRYEGYAPGGVAVIVDCMTDNKVRTVADVRHAFTKFGGNLGTDGSVAYLFKKARRAVVSRPARTRTRSWRSRSMRAPTTW
jgi:YebC/PmpR family DNA-binding regulatory protein